MTTEQTNKDLYGDYREPGWVMGWKATRPDGTTHGDYQWPLPTDGKPVTVKASGPIRKSNTEACPRSPVDGLCVIPEGHVAAATSGNVNSLASCIALMLRWKESDVLGNDGDGKFRVRSVQVLGLFDLLDLIRSGECKNLTGANLTYAYLRGANLTGAYLRGANLTGANLRGANLRDANLTGANLRYAYLTGADLTGAYLRGANLTGANLTGAYLTYAYLTGANLTGANLRDANLTDANLTGANLRYANLRDANLTGAIGVDRASS